jgi:hypothetical protein
MCLTSFQDGSELVDIKAEEVPNVKKEKEEEEDPLAITCQKLESEREVSFVSMYPM